MSREIIIDDFKPTPHMDGSSPDWHAACLREIARQLGVGSDAFYPLLGAANKIEMFQRGMTYVDAIAKEGN